MDCEIPRELAEAADPGVRLLQLRDYQLQSVEALRRGIRGGHLRQILGAPTGSGKTLCATHLMQEAIGKMSHALFVVDRIALVDQTSAMFDTYDVPHGVIQADHWRTRSWERIQIASAQTLARRSWQCQHDPQLVVVDECQTLHRSVIDFIVRHPELIVVGLSATPFTKGLGKIYSNVVNVATTHRLIEQGYLAALKTYVGKAPDMTGAKTKFDGEWQDSELEERGIAIIGDVVSEWIAKTMLHFGRPVKTIVFAPTVAHGDELCRRFQEAGFNFQLVSYRDRNGEHRRKLIEEFRKPDSEITGLVSCEALAKGFDVPDILCGIGARPYRKSLSGHVQQLGRVMRCAPGKEYALWLDHSNNFVRFYDDTQEFFLNGISRLDDGKLNDRVRREPTEREVFDFRCGECNHAMEPSLERCPACGWTRPRRKSHVIELPGELHEIELDKRLQTQPAWMRDRESVWRQLCCIADRKRRGNRKGFALAMYKKMFGEWPKHPFELTPREEPLPAVERKVLSQLIAYAKRKRPEVRP